MSLTIATTRVDDLQAALVESVRAIARLQELERDLRATRAALERASEAIYNATLYDPEGERDDAR